MDLKRRPSLKDQFSWRCTNTHTQHVVKYWSRVKAKFKRIHGTSDEHLSEYLDEFMWRERYGKTTKDAYENLVVSHIKEQYPLP